jgi:hypothetical protein
MSYVNPETVVAPKNKVESVEVLYDGGPGEWSVARLLYDGKERVGIRWNGADDEGGIGNPQSRGRPTWFVVPKELADIIREEVEKFENPKQAEMLAAYREMAADEEHEREAQEWCEGMIGDATHQEG